jgi:hypothetical protein
MKEAKNTTCTVWKCRRDLARGRRWLAGKARRGSVAKDYSYWSVYWTIYFKRIEVGGNGSYSSDCGVEITGGRGRGSGGRGRTRP